MWLALHLFLWIEISEQKPILIFRSPGRNLSADIRIDLLDPKF